MTEYPPKYQCFSICLMLGLMPTCKCDMCDSSYSFYLTYTFLYTQYLGKVGVVKRTVSNRVEVKFPDGQE